MGSEQRDVGAGSESLHDCGSPLSRGNLDSARAQRFTTSSRAGDGQPRTCRAQPSAGPSQARSSGQSSAAERDICADDAAAADAAAAVDTTGFTAAAGHTAAGTGSAGNSRLTANTTGTLSQ